jgi:hypothetical protein
MHCREVRLKHMLCFSQLAEIYQKHHFLTFLQKAGRSVIIVNQKKTNNMLISATLLARQNNKFMCESNMKSLNSKHAMSESTTILGF